MAEGIYDTLAKVRQTSGEARHRVMIRPRDELTDLTLELLTLVDRLADVCESQENALRNLGSHPALI